MLFKAPIMKFYLYWKQQGLKILTSLKQLMIEQ